MISSMSVFEVTTTVGCRNNCSFCPQSQFIQAYRQFPDADKVMSFSTYQTIVDKLPSHSMIRFSGFAEPFLNPDCLKMILYANQKHFTIQVFTTLMGLSLKDAETLVQTIKFSTQPEQYLTHNLLCLHLPSAWSAERIVVDHQYLAVLKYLLKTHCVGNFHYHGPKLNAQIIPLFKRFNLIPQFWSPFSRAGNNLIHHHLPKRKLGHISCLGFEHYGRVILPNGVVALCCMDYQIKHPLGNLFTDSYTQFSQSSTFNTLLRGWRNDQLDILCRYCPYAQNLNTKAYLFNSSFSFPKLTLYPKYYLYHYLRPIYYLFRTVKRLLFPNRTYLNNEADQYS
jgi:hypothetical protein